MKAARKEAKRNKKWREAPCGLTHDMDPFFMGLAAAEFIPADPATWFDAACMARMTFRQSRGVIVFGNAPGEDQATAEFLRGLLIGTLDGNKALHAFMLARGLCEVTNGA
jgi:hypothetical protein